MVNIWPGAHPVFGGMRMDANQIWHLFLETGAPELYLFYQRALRMEKPHVFDHTGTGAESSRLQ